MLNSSKAFGRTDYRALLKTWMDGTPEEWGLREENAIGGIGGAGLPMGFNRTPQYKDGLLLIGDAGGVVNPFNGEGIAYAMESAAMAAEAVLQALGRPDGPSREAALRGVFAAMKRQPRRVLPARRHLLQADRATRGSCAPPPGSGCPASG